MLVLNGNPNRRIGCPEDCSGWADFEPFSMGLRDTMCHTWGSEEIRIDTSSHLTNDQPNPNVGRALIHSRGKQPSDRTTRREAYRATAFYELDLTENDGWSSWLGKHVFYWFVERANH